MNMPERPPATAAELIVDPASDTVLDASAAARRLLGGGMDGLRLDWLSPAGGRARVCVAGDPERSFPYTAEVVCRGERRLLRLLLDAPEPEAAGFHEIVGVSAAVRQVLGQVALVAPTDATVLVSGESGTGKELIAHAIHRASRRAEAALVTVNCAAVPRELFESEFFGHVRGAFTGAMQDRVGRFEAAHGGTLFLDEVGEIPLELQGKLLRVLQEGELERVGDAVTRSVDVRVVAATNRDLAREVAAGRFREDLYYRLNVYPIESVPLRRRPEDIPLLASHFLLRACRRLGLRDVRLTGEDIRRLQGYHWPGNVRELENLVERGAIAATAGRLVFELPHERVVAEAAPAPRAAAGDGPGELMRESDRVRRDREMIVRALDQTGGKVFGPGGAAELLGVKPTTLASRIKRMGIERRGRG